MCIYGLFLRFRRDCGITTNKSIKENPYSLMFENGILTSPKFEQIHRLSSILKVVQDLNDGKWRETVRHMIDITHDLIEIGKSMHRIPVREFHYRDFCVALVVLHYQLQDIRTSFNDLMVDDWTEKFFSLFDILLRKFEVFIRDLKEFMEYDHYSPITFGYLQVALSDLLRYVYDWNVAMTTQRQMIQNDDDWIKVMSMCVCSTVFLYEQEYRHDRITDTYDPTDTLDDSSVDTYGKLMYDCRLAKDYLLQAVYFGSFTDATTDKECVVCMSAKRDIVLQPCGMCCMCYACYETMHRRTVSKNKNTKCPICRENIDGIVSVANWRPWVDGQFIQNTTNMTKINGLLQCLNEKA